MNTPMIGLAALVSLVAGSPAVAGDYPTEPIHIVVPFATGGASDIVARLAGDELSKALGQPVVIENKPGAAGNIGARQVAAAKADGYTLMHTSSAILVNQSLYKDPGYSMDQFQPLMMSGSNCSALVVNPSYGAGTLDELIDKARAETLHFGTAGVGSTPHISSEMLLNQIAKLNAVHVPYQGGGPALTAVLANEVPASFLTVATGNLVTMVKEGRLEALVVTCPERHPALPDTPTVIEAGFPEFGTDATWGGFFAPAGTPAPIVETLNRALNEVFAADPVHARIAGMGLSWEPQTTEAFSALLQEAGEQWERRVRAIGLEKQ